MTAIYTKETYRMYKDVIDAYQMGKIIQIKTSHRKGWEDIEPGADNIKFIVKLGIQYRIKPPEDKMREVYISAFEIES